MRTKAAIVALCLSLCAPLCDADILQQSMLVASGIKSYVMSHSSDGGKRSLAAEDGITCTVDEDCPDHPFFVCGVKKEGFCGHKTVFPVEPLEIGGIIVFAVVMALSNIAGIGGGGVAIPIIMAMFVFTTKPAIAISSFSIFLTTLARFVMNFKERHPDKHNVVVIDYDLVTIMMPTTLAGAQVGAIILVTFPSLIIQVILTAMLGLLSVQSLFKAIELTKKENKLAKEKLAMVKPETSENSQAETQKESREGGTQMAELKPITQSVGENEYVTPDAEENLTKKIEAPKGEFDPILQMSVSSDMNQNDLDILRKSVKAESSHFQWVKQGICILLLICLIMMNLMMGSSSMDSIVGIKKCEISYWAVQLAFILICVACAVLAVRIAQKNQTLKLKYGGVNLDESDIRYSDRKKLGQLLILGFVGGWVAGALGLGGGCVYNPALLALGIPPKVSSATGLYLVTFSKIASVLIYYMNDQLDLVYGLWIGLWSCIGMIIGLLLTQWYMKRTGRQSIIVWCLVVIFIVSTIAIPIFGGLSLKKESDEGLDLWAFSSLCEEKKK